MLFFKLWIMSDYSSLFVFAGEEEGMTNLGPFATGLRPVCRVPDRAPAECIRGLHHVCRGGAGTLDGAHAGGEAYPSDRWVRFALLRERVTTAEEVEKGTRQLEKIRRLRRYFESTCSQGRGMAQACIP